MLESDDSKVDPPSGHANDVHGVKYSLMLRAVGDAPPMLKTKFQLSGDKLISFVMAFLRKHIKIDKGIYVFCGSSFCPNPDQSIKELFDAFQIGGELTICYSFQETWG